jgi:hypothetical protein
MGQEISVHILAIMVILEVSLSIEAVGFINEDGTVIVYYDDSNNQGLFVRLCINMKCLQTITHLVEV